MGRKIRHLQTEIDHLQLLYGRYEDIARQLHREIDRLVDLLNRP